MVPTFPLFKTASSAKFDALPRVDLPQKLKRFYALLPRRSLAWQPRVAKTRVHDVT